MKFSDSVKGLIAETRKIAEKLDNDFVGLQHFLMAYNKFDDSAFTELKVPLSDKKDLIRDIRDLKLAKTKSSDFPLTKDFEFVLKSSSFQRWVLRDKEIEPKHLYLSILLIEIKNKFEYLRILESNRVKMDAFRRVMISIQYNPILRAIGLAKQFRKIT